MDPDLADELMEEYTDDPVGDTGSSIPEGDDLPPIKWDCEQFDPRPQQEEMLEFAQDSDKRYLMIDAPTGVGKSPVNVSIARSQGGIILTPQKMLQDQYTRDWPMIPVVKGAANYGCPEVARRTGGVITDCSMGAGTCSLRREQACPYTTACQEVVGCHTGAGIANYAWLLAVLGHTEWSGKQRWLIMDEGHQLEQALVSAAQVEIKAKDCEELGIPFYLPDTLEDSEKLADRFRAAAVTRVTVLKDRFQRDPGGMSKDEMSQLRRLDNITGSIGFMLWDAFDTEDGDREPNEWVMDADDADNNRGRDTPARVLWRPLYARGIFQRLIEPLNTRVLITSATLLNPDGMASWFGWDDYDSLKLESPFEMERRRIVYKGVVALNHRNLEERIPEVVAEIDRIISSPHHARWKGIIHTHSFKLARIIEELSRHSSRFICHRPGKNQAEIIAQHAASKAPTILVSPSLTEGVDLPGSLARFAIFPKVPYPYLGDSWVDRRKDVDPDWYDAQVAQTFVQGSGRIVRNTRDLGVTYILDAGFRSFYNRAAKHFPRWWLQSITWKGGP
jgi:ATP-dependent DNA helicase DinG